MCPSYPIMHAVFPHNALGLCSSVSEYGITQMWPYKVEVVSISSWDTQTQSFSLSRMKTDEPIYTVIFMELLTLTNKINNILAYSQINQWKWIIHTQKHYETVTLVSLSRQEWWQILSNVCLRYRTSCAHDDLKCELVLGMCTCVWAKMGWQHLRS